MTCDPLLSVRNLTITYRSDNTSIEGVGFTLNRGRVLGLTGESGSGKSSVCKAVLGLIEPALAAVSGKIEWMGRDILSMPYEERRKINGKDIVFIMQSPMTAFDPCMTIKNHFATTLMAHLLCRRRDALHYASETLRNVGLSDTDRIMNSYPHTLSGGMLQRIMIALAIALNPAVIVADEPTTALDAESQCVVLSLLKRIMRDYTPAMLLVSHDMRVLSLMSDDMAIMKDGKVIEAGKTEDVYENPRHPYTRELIAARSRLRRIPPC